MTILWRETMAIGDASVDADHRHLIDLINRVEVILMAAGGHAGLVGTMDELATYAHDHFEREESLMRYLSYNGLVHHRQCHRELRTRLTDLRREIVASKDQPISESETKRLIDLLRDWLLEHVLNEDFRFRDYLKQVS